MNLLEGEHEQVNRQAITQEGGKYAENIAWALFKLHCENLLSGESAQINFEVITQGGGEYAKNIAEALIKLHRANLLEGEDGQAYRQAITKGGGEYAADIADALIKFHSVSLRSEAKRTQGPMSKEMQAAIMKENWAIIAPVITHEGGKYASRILKSFQALDIEEEEVYYHQWLSRLTVSMKSGFSLGFLTNLLERAFESTIELEKMLAIFELTTGDFSKNTSEVKDNKEQEKEALEVILSTIDCSLYDKFPMSGVTDYRAILLEIIQLYESVSDTTEQGEFTSVATRLITKILPERAMDLSLINTLITVSFAKESRDERYILLIYLDNILDKFMLNNCEEKYKEYITQFLMEDADLDSTAVIERLQEDNQHLQNGGSCDQLLGDFEIAVLPPSYSHAESIGKFGAISSDQRQSVQENFQEKSDVICPKF